jgi:hypothetical protein
MVSPSTAVVTGPPAIARPGMPAGPAADRRPAGDYPADRAVRPLRSWPLLVLAAPAAAEVWSGWVGVARMTGFGEVSPLPGIWPSLRLDTSITLPVGVECYAALALRAWLASGEAVSDRTRRFAKWSATCSFLLGMAGQVAYHLMQQAGMTRAPWPVTMLVSCRPVLVLAMGTALAHMLRQDAVAPGHSRTEGPRRQRERWSEEDQDGTDWPGPSGGPAGGAGPGPAVTAVPVPACDRAATGAAAEGPVHPGHAVAGQARAAAERLAKAGKPVTRRTLRAAGVRGSNEALNALARALRAETTGRLSGRIMIPAGDSRASFSGMEDWPGG